MPRTNQELAAAFFELADLIDLTGGERFRMLAYRRAAETLEILARDVSTMSDKELTGLRGIGGGTAKKIREYLATGKIGALEDLRAEIPPGVREMTRLAGLGPKKAMVLHAELGIGNLDELRVAVSDGRLREVRGFGAKTEENLARALAEIKSEPDRALLGTALQSAERMVASLEQLPSVEHAEYAGSLRRMRETIGDIDLLASGPEAAPIMDAFVNLPEVARVLARGPTKSSVTVARGLQVDLRVVAPDEFGAALQYFTGSKQHNVKVREHAVREGLKLSEYGLFRVDGGERVAAETEKEVYAALGMQTPPPTMREDRGEVELALRGELPEVVRLEDIRGDLHGHSTYSDGRESIAVMAGEAARRGYRYWAITDHGRNLRLKSLEAEDVLAQAEEVRELNRLLGKKITVLHGVELNIGPDGGLDYPDDLLGVFDLRIASTHGPPWDQESMTRRLLAAIEHPLVNVLGHPTGRRLGRRPAAAGVALEINSNPQRLDLKDDHVWLARELGCVFSIATDSHRIPELNLMRLGVFTAQRGWVGKEEVVNTWTLPKLRKFLRRA
ncbi:MAG: DNA polymerase/3'-5' exonuclease PolX [Actinomycetota bacterium]